MATYVLVPGAWLGAWAWDRVAEQLRARGHAVYPMALTGLGERKHLARPDVGLETHIQDIVNQIEVADLRDVILVAHSYGGVPVTGAADRLVDRLASVVYVDTGPIPADTAFIDFEPEQRAATEQKVAEQGDGWLIPPISVEELAEAMPDETPERVAAIVARMTPQPFGTYTEPLRLSNPALATVPKVAVLNSFPESVVRELMAAGHPIGVMLSGPEWRFVELPTSHWPMFTRPDDLATVLDEIGATSGAPA